MELIITTENPATLEAIKEMLSAFSDVKLEYRKSRKKHTTEPNYKPELVNRIKRINNGTAQMVTFDSIEAAKQHFFAAL